MGIRWRIVVLAGAAVALAVVAAAVGSYVAVRGELLGQIDDSLNAQAAGLQALAEQGAIESRDVPRRLPGPPQAAPPVTDDGLSVQSIDPNGTISRFPRAGDPLPVTDGDRSIAESGTGRRYSESEIGGERFKVITVGIGKRGAVMIGRSLAGVDSVLERLRAILTLLAAGGIGLAAGLALLVGRRVVAPIRELTETAEHITATNDLARRIEVEGNDEVARLASRFNAMLEKIAEHQGALRESVNSQRQLVADASHELRTPVAAIRTDIEALLAHSELPMAEREKILGSAGERIEELTELILDLIELARGDQAVDDAHKVRLDLLVQESIERLERLAPEREVVASLEPTVIDGRPDRLFRAINNLLDNAEKYSPRGRPIEVAVADCSVEVRDHGPGIPEADLPRLFDRFWRGSTSRERTGSGLGLAIVRQVAEAGGGEVTVKNLSRGGTCFRLSFPVSEPAGPDAEPAALRAE